MDTCGTCVQQSVSMTLRWVKSTIYVHILQVYRYISSELWNVNEKIILKTGKKVLKKFNLKIIKKNNNNWKIIHSIKIKIS